MEKVKEYAIYIIVALIISLVFAYFVQYLWNDIMPDLILRDSNFKRIDYLTAFKLTLLCHLLFKSTLKE